LALQVQNFFFRSVSVIILNKKLLISARGSGGAESAAGSSSWVQGRVPEAKAFLGFT